MKNAKLLRYNGSTMNFEICNPTDSDFNLERHLIVFLQENAFYAEISRNLRKSATLSIPTCAVSYNPVEDEFILWYNPIFFGGGKYTNKAGEEIECEPLSNMEIRGALQHEFDHLVFGHLTARRKSPAYEWNIATDLAINSLIHSNTKNLTKNFDTNSRVLPKIALIPGIRPFVDPKEIEKATPFQLVKMELFCDMIEKFPKHKTSEYYFNKIMERKDKDKGEGDEDGDQLIDSMDDHESWDALDDIQRQYVEGKVKAIVERAVMAADSHPSRNGWGNIPDDIRQAIRASISKIVDWRAVLRQFVGSLIRGERTSSIKRINRRYPYVHPGVKRNYTAKLCIAIDQSGSVDDSQLNMFFAELASLTKRVTVDILPFDYTAAENDLFTWKKGTIPSLKRVRCGGTNFDAPTLVVNDPKNRKRWDGMLIMTDGECSPPISSRIKRGWVLSKGHKLNFDSPELQVFLDDSKPMTGAWR